MKNIKYIIIAICALGIQSCEDFLTPEVESYIDADSYYSTEEELEIGLINMYDGIQGVNSTNANDNHAIQVEFYLTEMRSDNTRTKASEGEAAQFENYTIAANNGLVADYYRSMYNVIFRANIVLQNLGVASAENAPKIEAEAKFVRAYAYLNLVRLFGDVPLVDQVLQASDPSYKSLAFTRISTGEIYDFIIADLQTAVDGLDNTYQTRASQAAAKVLLAKTYMTVGTNYLEAQVLLEDVLLDGYDLESNFQDVFFNELNDEIIFAIGFEPDGIDSQNFSAEWLNAVGRTSGVNYTTQDSRDALDALGGNRTPYSYRVDLDQPSQFQVVKYIPDGDTNLNIAPTSVDPTAAGNDWIVIRFADVLLLHVEAIMAGGTSTSAPAALSSFERVRLRAGLLGDDDGTITKQELLDERRVELAYENHRLFDLMRFGEAQAVLSAFSAATNGSFTASDLLLPIPQYEINLSQGLLTQNPGY